MPTARAENLHFYKLEPVREAGGAKTWYGRAQNLLVAYSRVESGTTLDMANSENEYFIVLMEGAIDVTSANGSAFVTGPAQIIVRPGEAPTLRAQQGRWGAYFPLPP